MTWELRVEVSHGEVEAKLKKDDATPEVLRGKDNVGVDPLRLQTVRLLQQWLGRWQIVSHLAATYKGFPVLETFRVLGEHLYQIVFPGEVGAGFMRSYEEAQAAGQSLRVLLSFAEDSSGLAVLPWEFLYRRSDSGASFYLATRTKLVLSRFIQGPMRSTMRVVTPPLRALFILCFPEREDPEQEEYTRQRQEVLASIRKLKESLESIDTEEGRKRLEMSIVDNWDIARVDAELKTHPHVVHIIGHARQAHDAVGGRWRGEIQLPGADGSLQWNDPQPVIELLTRGKSAEELPRLVILHLCEMEPVDFTASFERLAPELIEAGILAVLAMQYPMSVDAASSFTSTFYARLAVGDEVDEIVQTARSDLHIYLGDDRPFGTPVLYMQSPGGRLVAKDTEIPNEGKVDPHQVSTRAITKVAGQVRERLKSAVSALPAKAADEELTKELKRWIDGISWSDDTAENEELIRQYMRLDPYLMERFPMYKAMLEALSEGTSVPAG